MRPTSCVSSIVVLTMFGLAAPCASAMPPADIFKLAEPSIVVVLAADAKGEKNVQASGVVIAPQEILTSCKIIEGAADIVVAQGSDLRPARVRHADTERDLCQLQVDRALSTARPAAPDTAAAPQVGDELYLVSSPRGLNRTLARIMVTGQLVTPGASAALLQIDGSHESGSQGGGLFDAQGRLVAVLTPQFRQGNSSAAMPVQWAAELAKRAPERTQTPTPSATPSVATNAEIAAIPWHPAKGERWRYKLIDGKRDAGVVTVEIADAAGGRVRERITLDRSSGNSQERDVVLGFDPRGFQKLAALPGGYQLAEIAPYIPPEAALQPGRKWADVPGEFRIQGSASKAFLSEVRVIKRERIRVPAGDFEVWRIETKSNRVAHNGVFFSIHCIFWNAPEIKRSVRMQINTQSSVAALNGTEVYELVSHDYGK